MSGLKEVTDFQLQKDSEVMMLSFSQSQSVWWKFFDQIFFLRFGKRNQGKKNLKYSSILQNKGKFKTARLLQIHFLGGTDCKKFLHR